MTKTRANNQKNQLEISNNKNTGKKDLTSLAMKRWGLNETQGEEGRVMEHKESFDAEVVETTGGDTNLLDDDVSTEYNNQRKKSLWKEGGSQLD